MERIDGYIFYEMHRKIQIFNFNNKIKLHASELDDTSDWNKIKDLKSVTEQSSLDEFLTNAELANSNFESGKKLY